MARESKRNMMIGAAGILAGALLVSASIDTLLLRNAAGTGALAAAGQHGAVLSVKAPSPLKSRAAELVARVFDDLWSMVEPDEAETDDADKEDKARIGR